MPVISCLLQILDGQMHGKGTLVYPNGERYEGSWVRNPSFCRHAFRMHCYYSYPCIETTHIYAHVPFLLCCSPPVCVQLHGKRHGFGIYYYLDGGRYEGEWNDDRISGKGKSIYSNGNVYEGEWTDGRINGFGTLLYSDGDKYVGTWADGKMNGQVGDMYACVGRSWGAPCM